MAGLFWGTLAGHRRPRLCSVVAVAVFPPESLFRFILVAWVTGWMLSVNSADSDAAT